MEAICRDLDAEHAALDAMVADLDEAGWRSPTKAAGWDVRATVVHIAYFDDAAREAAADPDAFARRKAALLSGQIDIDREFSTLTGAEVLAWWRRERSGLLAGLAPLGPKDRIPWFGPSMSALSFATARLMETWAHGSDVAVALGKPIPNTDRLRHVAHIGVTTRGWSYANRGLAVPEGPVRVELRAPSGELWEWGPADAADVVRADALDFCLVVTQRVLFSASQVEAVGPLATEWMGIAQAFAGPPTITDAQRA